MADDRYSYNRQLAYDLLKQEGYTDIGDSAEELFKDRGNSELAYNLLSKAGYTDIGKDYNEFANMLYGPEQETKPKSRASAFNERVRAMDEARGYAPGTATKREEAAAQAMTEGRMERQAERMANIPASSSEGSGVLSRSAEFNEKARQRDEKYAGQQKMTPKEVAAFEEKQAEEIRARQQRQRDRVEKAQNKDRKYADLDYADLEAEYARKREEYEPIISEYQAKQSVNLSSPEDYITASWLGEHNTEYNNAINDLMAIGSELARRPEYIEKTANILEDTNASDEAIGSLRKDGKSLNGELLAAQLINKKIRQLAEQPYKNDRTNKDALGYLSGAVWDYGKGTLDRVKTAEWLSRGLTKFVEGVNLRPLQEKLQGIERDAKGYEGTENYDEVVAKLADERLTDEDRLLLGSYLNYGRMMELRADNVPLEYRGGQMFADTAGYMIDFLLTRRVDAVGRNAAGRALGKWAPATLFGKGVKASALELGGAFTRTLSMVPQTLGQIGDSLSETEAVYDENGNIDGEKMKRTVVQSVADGIVKEFIDVASEGSGQIMEKAVGSVIKGTLKRSVIPKTLLGRQTQEFLRGMGGLIRRGQIQSLGYEDVEEILGATANVVASKLTKGKVGDADAMKQILSKEGQQELLLGFLPLTAVGTIGSLNAANKMKMDYDSSMEKWNTLVNSNVGVTEEDLNNLVDGLENKSTEDLMKAEAEIYDKIRQSDNTDMTEAEVRDMLNKIVAGRLAEDLQGEVWGESQDRVELAEAYAGSYGIPLEDNLYDINQAVAETEAAAKVMGFTDEQLGKDASVLMMEAVGLSNRGGNYAKKADALREYALAKARQQAINDGYKDTGMKAVRQIRDNIQNLSPNGQVAVSTYDGKQVLVRDDGSGISVDGGSVNLNGNTDILVQVTDEYGYPLVDMNGETVPYVKASQLGNTRLFNADDYIETVADSVADEMNAHYKEAEITPSHSAMGRQFASLTGRTILAEGAEGEVYPLNIVSVDPARYTAIVRNADGKMQNLPIDMLYNMAQKDDAGAVMLDPTAEENRQATVEEPVAETELPVEEEAAEPEQGQQNVEDLVGAETSIVMNGQPTDVFVTEVSDGRVFFDVEDAEGNASHFDMPVAEFERAMNGEEAPAAEPEPEPEPAPAPAEEPAPEAVPQNGTIPVNPETGKKNYDDPSVTPEMAYEDLYGNVEEGSKAEENRDKWVTRKSEEADKAVKDAEKLVAGGEAKKKAIDNWDIKDNEDLEDLEARQNKAKEKVDAEIGSTQAELPELRRKAAFWKELKEVADANAEARKQQAERQKIIDQYGVDVRGFDLEPRSMEELLARELTDFFRSGYKLSRKSVLDIVGKNLMPDLRKGGYAFVLSNDGVPVDKFVMDVDASYPGFIKDEQDAINAVGDLIMGHTRGELADYIFNNRLEEARRLMAEMENEEVQAQETETPAVPEQPEVPETPVEEPQAPAEETAEEAPEDLPEDMPEEIAEPAPVAEQAEEEVAEETAEEEEETAPEVPAEEENAETNAPKPDENGAENEAPVSETQEESVTSQKKEEEKVEEPETSAGTNAVVDLAKQLGFTPVVIRKIEDIPETESRARAKAEAEGLDKVQAWVNTATNQVFVVDGSISEEEAQAVVQHEIVTHIGLPKLLGKEDYDKLCDAVWDGMSENDSILFGLYAMGATAPSSATTYEAKVAWANNILSQFSQADIDKINSPSVSRRAADEYMASLAQKVDFSRDDKNVWNRIKDAFRVFLTRMKIALGGEITNEDIITLIEASKTNLAEVAETEQERAMAILTLPESALSQSDKERMLELMEMAGATEDEMRDARRFISGENTGLIAQAGYMQAKQKALEYVRSRPGNLQPNSGAGNGAQLDQRTPENQGPESGVESGGQSVGVGEEGSGKAVPEGAAGGANGNADASGTAGAQGNNGVSGNGGGLLANNSDGKHTGRGRRTGGNGQKSQPGRASGKNGGSNAEGNTGGETGSRPDIASAQGEVDSILDELDSLGADTTQFALKGAPTAGKLNSSDRKEGVITLEGKSPEQISLISKLGKALAKAGYALIQDGVRAFNLWTAQMKSRFGQKLRENKVLRLTDEQVDAYISEIWESDFEIDGKVMRVREWADEIGREALRNVMKMSEAEKRRLQKAADKVVPIFNDIANIREMLPFLLPDQQEDVLKAETQFFNPLHQDKEHGYGKGYLFTNATGTGKTFTGAGIIKRFVKSGRGRVLIITPTQNKVSDWISEGARIDLEINPLADTKDVGEGVVCTTYANFRENEAIMNEDFDLIVYDESHNITKSLRGTETEALRTHFQLANKDEEYAMERLTNYTPFFKQLNDWKKQVEENGAKIQEYVERIQTDGPIYTEKDGTQVNLNVEIAKLQNETRELQHKIAAAEPHIDEETAKLRPRAKEAVKKTKVVFLSASAFATHPSLRYAEGFIFSYPELDKLPLKRDKASIEQAKLAKFLMDNFPHGYKRKSATAVIPQVSDADRLEEEEVAFTEYLFNSLNTASGRMLMTDKDYARTFPTLPLDMADRVNSAANAILTDKALSPLSEAFQKTFYDYNYGNALLETMKASLIIPRIKQHLARGRKVVVFHSRLTSKDPIIPPFQRILELAETLNSKSGDPNAVAATEAAQARFRSMYPDVLAWEQRLDYTLPREQFVKAFGKDNVLLYSGQETNKTKEKNVATFQDDNSGKNLIVVQVQSGSEGISLHDKTGKFQRVNTNLSLPRSPILAIQGEGRTLRIGSESNAIFEYPLVGLDFETWLFSSVFAGRAGTQENLSMGPMARGLRDAFMNGVLEHSGVVSLDEDSGGKAYDSKKKDGEATYEKAIQYYHESASHPLQEEETPDGMPTPEPLGFKMVQWAGLQDGEAVLEPSAGRGAIARFVPKKNKLKGLDSVSNLVSRLMLKLSGGGRNFEVADFMNFDIHNKYDAVLMNPPSGENGVDTAYRHVSKAFKHLVEGGRLIAVVPAEMSVASIDDSAMLTGEILLPPVASGARGPMKVVILDRVTRKGARAKMSEYKKVDMSGAMTMDDFFARLKDVEMPGRKIDSSAKIEKAINSLKKALKVEGTKGIIAEDRKAWVPEVKPIKKKYLSSYRRELPGLEELDDDSTVGFRVQFLKTSSGYPYALPAKGQESDFIIASPSQLREEILYVKGRIESLSGAADRGNLRRSGDHVLEYYQKVYDILLSTAGVTEEDVESRWFPFGELTDEEQAIRDKVYSSTDEEIAELKEEWYQRWWHASGRESTKAQRMREIINNAVNDLEDGTVQRRKRESGWKALGTLSGEETSFRDTLKRLPLMQIKAYQQMFDQQMLSVQDKDSAEYRNLWRMSKIAESVHQDAVDEINGIISKYGYALKRQGVADGLEQMFKDFSKDGYNSTLFEKLLPVIKRLSTKVLFTDTYSDSTAGSYNSGNNQLLLNASSVKNEADMAVTILHELIHDASTYAQYGRERGKISQEGPLAKAALRANRLWQALLLSPNKPSWDYPLRNDRELLAGISDKGFRDWLSGMDVYVDNAENPTRYSIFSSPSTPVKSNGLTELEHVIDGFLENASAYEHSHINVPDDRSEVHQHNVKSENVQEYGGLTEEQQEQVHSEAFKKWFGDWENDPENASKIVSENGEPRVLYHGTKMPFWEFDGGKTRGLFSDGLNYFALDRQFAEDWARHDDEKRRTPEDNKRLEAAREKRREHGREIVRQIKDKYGESVDYSETPEWKEYESNRKQWERDNLDLDGMTLNEAMNDLGKRVLPVFINSRNPYNPTERYESEGRQMLIDLGLLEPEPTPMSEMYARGGAYLYYENKKVVDELKKRGYDSIYLSENVWSDPSKNLRTLAVWDANRIKSATENTGEFDPNNSDIRYREETDADVIERLDSEPKVTAYRAMQFVPDPNGEWEFDLGDGKGMQRGNLYPPMSAMVDGKWREPVHKEKWERSVEAPEKVNAKGQFMLYKGNGKYVPAAYNPYLHSSDSMLNDQFAEAQSRDNLVVVEVQIPEREVSERNMNPYRAEKAKNAVGKHEWKAGPVQQQLSGTRNVYLSRWDKPTRIVPVSEVADNVARTVKGEVAEMPSNVVWPQLRKELEDRGIPFVETDNQGKFTDGDRKGQNYQTYYKAENRLSKEEFKALEKRRKAERKERDETHQRIVEAEIAATNRTLDSMGEALGVKINRVGRDGMPKGHKTAKGYFNPRTGEMTICMDNVTDERDAVATVLHETVGHKGLRELFGAQFNDAMVRIYAALDSKGKMWVNAYMARHDLQPGDTDSIILGMEEYLSHLAESGDFKRSVWDNIKEILGKIVDLLFGTDGFTFTDRELNYILRASYEHLKNPNWLNTPLGKAQDTLWKRELGINETDPNRPTDPDGPGTGILYRDGETEDNALGNYEAGLARKGTAMITENQNADLPVKIGMEAVMKEVGMTELREDMDYLQRHNLASSRADTEAHDFELFRFTPMLEQVREVQSKLVGENATNEDREDAYNEIRDYLYAVSGLERNNYKNNEIEQEKKDALANADSAFKTAVDAIENNGKLSDNDKSAEIAKLEKKLAEKKKDIEEKYEAMKKDWSGLTGLTGHVESEWWQAEDDARKLIKDFKRKVGDNVALNELWNRIRACTDYSLEHAYKHGLLTRDEYEKLHGTATQPRMWNYYLPLRGFAQGTAEDVYSYSTFLNPSTNSVVTRKMKGRKTEADDPLATILNIAETEIVQGNDNWAKQALLKFVQSVGNNSLLTEKEPWYVKDTVTGKWSLGIPEDDETLEHFEARMQDLREKGEAKKGRRGLKLENIMANKAHRNEHLIHVKVGGLDKMIWVNGNPALAKAVTGFGKKQSYQWIRRASRVLSNLFTTYSLDFSVKNLIRDTLYSRVALAVKEDREYRRKFSENWWKNGGVTAAPIIKLAAMWNSGELQRIPEDQRTERQQLFIDFMHDGGQTGYTIINSVSTIKRSLERSMRRAGKEIKEAEFPVLGVRIPLFDDYAKLVSTLNEGFELLTRFTAYQTSRQSGRSGQRSASDAKEISVNFNRRGAQSNEGIWGHIAAFLGATHYFYNAGVQGFDNYLRLFKANTKKMTTLTAGFMVMGILTPLVNGLIAGATGGGDDDWYWNIPEWVRRNNIIIGWKGTYIALPLPVEFRAPYGIGDITGAAFLWNKYANRKGGKIPFGDLALDLLSTASNILPVNPVEGYEGSRNIGDAVLRAVAPDATMFIVDIATNRDYTGRPLWKENPFSETTPKCFGAYASTPKGIVNACQKLSELTYNRIDIAPGAVRDFMNNYGGGFFRTAEDVSKILRPLFEDDPDRPFRWDNIPFLSGFTGHIDQDRSNSYAKDALNEYRQLSESVVAKVASQVGGKVSSSDVYDNPDAVLDMTESAFRRARIQKIFNSKDYELGKMYREGMNNEYEMKQYVRGEKAGQWYKSRNVKRKGVDALKQDWLKLRDEWVKMPSETADEKSAKALVQTDVENAWHVYYDAEANLADELMKKEYGK